MNYTRALLGVVVFVLVVAATASGQFNNVTTSAGLGVPPVVPIPNGPPVEGRGSAWADFDGDGLVDVIVAGGLGQPVRLFTNSPTSTFTSSVIHSSTTLAHYGCAAADFDNDGDQDVFIAVGDGQANLLLVNDGTGSFTDEAALRGVAMTGGGGYARCLSFGDLNRDGWLDLYVGEMPAGPGSMPTANTLFLADGAGSFIDISAAGGAAGVGETLATLFHDFDGDGWLDIYTANDRGDLLVPNQLYLNTRYGPYSDQSAAFNAGAPMDGMGITVGDIENDGDWDMFVTNRLGPVLFEFDASTGAYVPPPGGDYRARATAAGLFTFQVGWACHFLDYDQDTNLDLFVVHQDLVNRIYRGDGAGSFTDETISQNIAVATLPDFSCSITDYDRDGDLDIFMPGGQTPSALVRNDNAEVGNWLILEAEGTVSNRDAIGLVAIVTVGGTKMRRMLASGEGYLCDNEKILHFGVGAATVIDEIELRWPSGTVNYLTQVPANQRLQVVEPIIEFTPPPAVGVTSLGLFDAPEDAGTLAVVGFSLSLAGEYTLPDARAIRIPLGDPLFQLTSAPSNPYLQGSFAPMTPNGLTLIWDVPSAWVAFSGFPVHFLGVTISPTANGFVRSIHGPRTIVIQ